MRRILLIRRGENTPFDTTPERQIKYQKHIPCHCEGAILYYASVAIAKLRGEIVSLARKSLLSYNSRKKKVVIPLFFELAFLGFGCMIYGIKIMR